MASATRQPFSFLDLPGEIRNSIYSYSFLPKTIDKSQERKSEEPRQKNFEKRRNYRGTSKVLRLCRQVYNECHYILHDQQKTLKLSHTHPLAPSSQPRPPLFRHPRTSYKPSVNIFTSTEFRRFTNVVLEIDYLFLLRALRSHPFHDEKASRDLEHALWVLGGSYSLEKLCLRLFLAARGSGTLTDLPRPLYFMRTLLLLAPIVRFGGLSTKMLAENLSVDIDPVVNWFNRSRRQWEAGQNGMDSYNGGIQIFPTGFKFSSAVERSRLMRRDGSMLVDVRKLFEDAKYLNQSIPTRNFKCCECFMVFESAQKLSVHQHASLHYAKTILHDSMSFREACSEFCRHESKKYRFKRRPDSAFRCGTCLTKYSYEEGLKVHLAFWKHSAYDPVSAYEDIGRLFDPLYKPYSKCFECRACWAFYECKNQLFKHLFGKKHFYPPDPADRNNGDHGVITPFKCGQCEKIHRSIDDVHQHLKNCLYTYQERESGYPSPLFYLDRHTKKPHQCRQCHAFFESQVSLINHIKRVNASRYAEPCHYIALHHPSIPVRRPGKIWCLHHACQRSFSSKTQAQCHGHAEWKQPGGSSGFKKMKRRGKLFEQVELPVESEDGFKCGKCDGFFETRNLLQRHLEHGKEVCGWKC